MIYLIGFLVFINVSCVIYIMRLHYEKGGIVPILKKPNKSPADLVAKEIINSLTNDSSEWTFTKYDAVHLTRDFEIWRSGGASNVKLNGMEIFTPNQQTEIFQCITDCLCNQILETGNKIAFEELEKYNKELLEG